jgi:hypothetical protein
MINNGIGGYFELELRQGEHFHKDAIKLNTARNCLEYILRARKYSKLYIPYYTCEVILEPIQKCKIEYEFYSINKQLEPVQEYVLKNEEAFLYTNYFGLKNKAVTKLSNSYQTQLIVDNSQSFYTKPIQGIDTFYSARKFFGVPDGAYLYTDKYLPDKLEQDCSYTRMEHLLKRIDISAEDGYIDFRNNDDSLINQPILKMSKLTERLLRSIDYEYVKKKRIENYKILDEELCNTNLLHLNFDKDTVPMIYPYFSEEGGIIKENLIKNRIFVPTYWNKICNWIINNWENHLVNNLVCLPIDQRYADREMNKIINICLRK